jgi:DNA-binding transcriptional MerR regulator
MVKIQSTTTLVEWHTAKAAARISGLSEGMINYLCRHSIVTPSHGKKRGRGTVREYTYGDVLLLRIIAKLLTQGVSVLRLKKSLIALQKRGTHAAELVSQKFVITDGRNVYFGDGTAFEVMTSGQMAFAFVLELGSIRRYVDAKIARKAA